MEHPYKRTKFTLVSPLHKCKSQQCRNIPIPPKLTKINQFRTDIQCQNCNSSWVVCTLCNKRFSLKKLYLAENHFMNQHGAQYPNSTNATSLEDNSTNLFHIETDLINDNLQMDGQDITLQNSINDINDTNLSTISKNYLAKEAESKSKGLKDIVGSSFFQSSNYPIEPSESESKYNLQVTKFLLQIPTTLHQDFLSIINQSQNSSNFQSTRLPENSIDISKIYLSGKSSIYNLLPVPKIMHDSEHAFISLFEIIQFHVAFIWKPNMGQEEHSMQNNSNIHRNVYNCMYARESRQDFEAKHNSKKRSLNYLYLVLWSDDFEPNHIRKNKHSTWIRSVTVYTKDKSPDENTYILSLGHKSTNHNYMNEKLIQELDNLGKVNNMYCAHLKCKLPNF